MSKAMTQATGVHSLRVRVEMAMIAVLLVALVALQPTPTAKDREAKPANPVMSAEGKGIPRSVNYDPAIDRHAVVVQRLGGGSLR
jgi:hypothetical protein